MNSMVLLLLLAALVLLPACNGTDERDEAANVVRLEAMKQEILDLVGVAACEGDADCRFIALGDKPCGGPWRYLVYSVTTVDTVTLATKVAAYNAFNRQLNEKYGWKSDCSVPAPPNVGCRQGRCADLGSRP